METVYSCSKCGIILFEKPTRERGRCPNCWNKLYPDNYDMQVVHDGYIDGFNGKVYPAPSWEEDL